MMGSFRMILYEYGEGFYCFCRYKCFDVTKDTSVANQIALLGEQHCPPGKSVNKATTITNHDQEGDLDQLYIVWQEEHYQGIPIIDEQHRGFVSIINSLYYYVAKGAGSVDLKPALSAIKQYSAVHFATQEALMKEAGYPDYNQHREFHQNLTKELWVVGDRGYTVQGPLSTGEISQGVVATAHQ